MELERRRGWPRAVLGACVLAWPLAAYLLRERVAPATLLGALLLLAAPRLLLSRHPGRATRGGLALAVGTVGAALLAHPWPAAATWLRLYPALLDSAVAALFLASLATRQPLVERIARCSEPQLPPPAVRYTRHVTLAWGLVMAALAAGALYTALATSLRAWSLYNGVLAYLVMGLVFVVEYALRCRLRRRWMRE